jgi:hypothetical protein
MEMLMTMREREEEAVVEAAAAHSSIYIYQNLTNKTMLTYSKNSFPRKNFKYPSMSPSAALPHF